MTLIGRRQLLGLAIAALAALSAVAVAPPDADAAKRQVRTLKIHYRARDGHRRAAYVLLPAWYGRRRHPRIPLVISPHGRGLTGRQNARLWGALPARGGFAVVNPDGLSPYSWGSAGQVADLARMPQIAGGALPWLRIDRRRIYAFGGSMGGQETLLLLARHPRLLAGAAVFDAVSDFALQYRRFPEVACNRRCRQFWRPESLGRHLQRLARTELGGPPTRRPFAYARRSPLTYASRIARSCVPLQIWWSVADRIVVGQRQQSGRLFWKLRQLNRDAPVQAFVGSWIHSAEMRAKAKLPLALQLFDLLPTRLDGYAGVHTVPPPPTAAECGS